MIQLTDEQRAVIESKGDIKINAVAGSGKTSTLIHYAKKQNTKSRILYIAFNRSVKIEAQERFAKENLRNVDVQTAHSLAYRQIVFKYGFTVVSGYKPYEIVQLLSIQNSRTDPFASYAIAYHIIQYTAAFCASCESKVDNVDYYSTISDPKAQSFAHHYKDPIRQGTRLFLAKMDRGEIPVTHEFYLKKFQLSQPNLPYDYILFDEGQDASPVMLNIFLSQRATKVIVGDAHQQIYGWRRAINALGSVDFVNYPLTTSFRFDSTIADLAMKCLSWKKHFVDFDPVKISGAGKSTSKKMKATLARTNLFLLRAAISMISSKASSKKLYFEGNINSYTYAAEGASIFDVLNLRRGNVSKIRDPLVQKMGSFEELVSYADESNDMELRMLIDIVEEYGNDLPQLISILKDRHVTDEDKKNADMIFSTVHRCKGMEYDQVTLEDDFINEERILRLCKKDPSTNDISLDKLEEEVNLAYVAITRTKNQVTLPDDMFPDEIQFHKKASLPTTKKNSIKIGSSDWFLQKRSKHPNAYKPWKPEDDLLLEKLHYKGTGIKELTKRFNRNEGAIRSRLKKLGLDE